MCCLPPEPSGLCSSSLSPDTLLCEVGETCYAHHMRGLFTLPDSLDLVTRKAIFPKSGSCSNMPPPNFSEASPLSPMYPALCQHHPLGLPWALGLSLPVPRSSLPARLSKHTLSTQVPRPEPCNASSCTVHGSPEPKPCGSSLLGTSQSQPTTATLERPSSPFSGPQD